MEPAKRVRARGSGADGRLKPRWSADPLKHPEYFRDALVEWFRHHGRDYPWRRTRDPYAVLVSEVMLQQTQIATVLGKNYFTRFIASFPDVRSLAGADDASLLKAWEGLGYYRRARMLRDTARAVLARHGGAFPESVDELLDLPGIGRYTAGALRAFAFGKPSVLVDGNVARVLARLMDFNDPIDESAGQRQLWQWAERLADDDRPRDHHSALMELGQTHCRNGVPDCLSCPVARFCRTQEPAALPVKARKTAVTDIAEHALWIRHRDGRLLLHRESGGRRTGLWKLPLREPSELAGLPILASHRYGITRFKVTLSVHDGGVARRGFRPAPGDAWVDAADIPAVAMAAPFRKVVERLLEDL